LFAIDSNGNLTQKVEGSDTWTYEWNANNELTRVTKNSVEQARFSYDPRGRRVEKVASGVTTSYVYDGARILREVRGSSTLKYVQGRGSDEPLAAEDGSAQTYFHADSLGSIVKVTNAAGAVALARQYDAWGNLEAGASEPGYAFTGREWDPQVGLYYYRARFQDPKIGRFVSEDPSGLVDGVNLYSYVRNNPTRWVDPSGRWAASAGGGGGIAIIPPLPFPPVGITADANCQIAVDGQGNIGILCCVDGGPAVGIGGEAGPQGAGSFCPSCRTICDLEDWYFQFTGGFAKGPGGMGSAGPMVNEAGLGVAASGGPAGGAAAYVGIQFGGCKLLWKKKPCCTP
jgi:RHS repeat-associated protein